MITQNLKTLKDVIQTFSDEQKCIDYLESIIWNGNPVSPFDPNSKVYKCKNNRYRCKNTGKYFNIKTGTIFEGTKIKLQDWFIAIWMYMSHKGGLSSMELKRELGVIQKTAWFMLQRIRNCCMFDNKSLLNDEVEMDETYVGGKNKNRHAHKRIKECQGRSCKGKTPVFGMIERNGKAVARVVPTTTAKDLMPHIVKHVESFSTVYTDEWGAYNGLKETYDHHIVRHNIKEYVNGNVHTNNIENFWGNLKRGIIGVHRVVSPQHIQFYVNEFVFRRNTCKFAVEDRFTYFVKNVRNYRLTYNELIKKCS
ncbi:MAG: IS1595 family transposase [Duncaniella sp.]|nr:IS1595 family transposase [Duncaniella sp.]